MTKCTLTYQGETLTSDPVTWEFDHQGDGWVTPALVAPDGRTLRALVDLDDWPHPPENEGGYPILEIHQLGVRGTGYGHSGDDGLCFSAEDALGVMVNRFGMLDGAAAFARWLEIFYGGRAIWCPDGDGNLYVAYVTEAMAKAWGGDVADAVAGLEMDEWIAWLNGDVYQIEVQVQVDSHGERRAAVAGVLDSLPEPVRGEPRRAAIDAIVGLDEPGELTWQTVQDSVCGGHYGTTWALVAALEALHFELGGEATMSYGIES